MVRCCLGVFTLALVCSALGVAQADDQASNWDQLIREKDAFFARMGELQQAFPQAQPEEKIKLREEFMALSTRFEQQILPQLEQATLARLQAPFDEATLNVANELMQIEFQRNQYPMVRQLAELILKQKPQQPLAANMGAVAKFATHDFEGAVAGFEAAQSQGILIEQLAGQYLGASKAYVEFWKAEQALRAGEDAAAGDQLLPRVKLATTSGDVVLELFEDQAPNTVANFISLVEAKFYDGLKFHRVIPGFMAQGGCPFTKDGQDPRRAGQGGPGYQIACECYAPGARRHFAGSISMAHAGKDSGGSQFFITHLPTPHLDRDMNPNGAHTVFGRVIEGMDVVYDLNPGDTIQSATVLRKRSHEYKPATTPDPVSP